MGTGGAAVKVLDLESQKVRESTLAGVLNAQLLLLLTFASREGLAKPFGQKPLDLMEFERLLRRNEVSEVLMGCWAEADGLQPGSDPEHVRTTRGAPRWGRPSRRWCRRWRATRP